MLLLFLARLILAELWEHVHIHLTTNQTLPGIVCVLVLDLAVSYNQKLIRIYY